MSLVNHSCPFGNNCNHSQPLPRQRIVYTRSSARTSSHPDRSREATFNQLGNLPTPQILFGIGGTYAYGSCQSASGSTQIPGSFYCAKTNTIILEYQQLEELGRNFGDGAIIYALAHEYAHYIQTIMGIQNPITMQELQADCIAGVLLKSTAKKLGLNDSDIQEIISTARETLENPGHLRENGPVNEG